MSEGLLGGIGAGLQGLTRGFQAGSQLSMQKEQQRLAKQAREEDKQLRLASQGLMEDEQGQIVPTSQRQRQLAFEEAQTKAGLLERGIEVTEPEEGKFMLAKTDIPVDDKELKKATRDLRKEYLGNPAVKAAQEVTAAYKKVQSAAENPSAAADLSLIFNYMKLLDPGSVVREGEFATAQNAAGIPDRIRNQYNRVIEGTRLGPAQRQDFVTQAGNVYQAQLESLAPVQDFYRQIAKESGIPESAVMYRFTQPTAPRRLAEQGSPQPAVATEEGAPKIGAVESGYRFKGGDPGDKSNWEKVR